MTKEQIKKRNTLLKEAGMTMKEFSGYDILLSKILSKEFNEFDEWLLCRNYSSMGLGSIKSIEILNKMGIPAQLDTNAEFIWDLKFLIPKGDY